jgi:hypothetical protein
MDGWVMVPIPVSPKAAERLRRDPERAAAVGRLVSDAVMGEGPYSERLIALMEQIGREAQASGLTEAEVDAELAAWHAKRRR